MIFNRDVLKIDSEYFNWSDDEIRAHYLPQMRVTNLSMKHKEEAEAKQAKKDKAAANKVAKEKEKLAKAQARKDKLEAKAKEDALLAGMLPADKKQYLKNRKQEKLMTGEAKLL